MDGGLCHFFPHPGLSLPKRWKDLMQYQLLILRTYRDFSSSVWLVYDQAFSEHAAASRLTDWSSTNVQLFNFHSAGSSARGTPLVTSNDSPEPPGSSSSVIHWKSWNKERCTASFAATLTGAVCAISCPNQSVKARSDESKRHSALQVPQGRAFGLRLPLVYPFSSCLSWTRGRSLCLISVIVIKLTFLVLSEL